MSMYSRVPVLSPSVEDFGEDEGFADHVARGTPHPAAPPSTRTTPASISASMQSPRPILVRISGPSAPGFGAGCPGAIGVLDSLGAGPQVVTRPMSSCSRVMPLEDTCFLHHCLLCCTSTGSNLRDQPRRASIPSLSQPLVLFLLALACCLSQPELLRPSQYKLVWVRGESLDYSEDARTKAKVRLRVRIEPGK
jgi:hypothetical protein